MTLLASITDQINLGSVPTDAQLGEVLKIGSRSQRFAISRELAQLLSLNSHIRQARLLADRAFSLWDGEPDFIDEYLKLLQDENDTEQILKVSKRAGILMCEYGDLSKAIQYFNTHQYAYAFTGHGDHYEYDREILKAIEQLAFKNNTQFSAHSVLETDKDRPVRIAYILHGATHVNSVLIRLMLDFARYHKKNQFECIYFSPDINCDSRQKNAALLRETGANFIAIDSYDEIVCLVETAKLISNFQPDIVVTVAALADYRNYYLYCTCPQSIRVALCYASPAQYIPPNADFAISATWHPLIDSPCDGKVVAIEATLSDSSNFLGKMPEGLNIPESSVVLLAAGRSEKFLNQQYWSAIFDVLKVYPNAYFVACGLTNLPSFLDKILTNDIRERVLVLGWLENYHELLAIADIVIDTYPSGGGLTIIDSMSCGLPVLSFHNNYLEGFNQTSWSLGDEIIGIPELLVNRDDFTDFKSKIIMLINSTELRSSLGLSCKSRVYETRSQPARMIKSIEKIYIDLVKTKKERVDHSKKPIKRSRLINTFYIPFIIKSSFRRGLISLRTQLLVYFRILKRSIKSLVVKN